MNKVYEFLDEIGTNSFIRTLFEISNLYFDNDEIEDNVINKLVVIIESLLSKDGIALKMMESIYGIDVIDSINRIKLEIINDDTKPNNKTLYVYKELDSNWIFCIWDEEWFPIGSTDYILLDHWDDIEGIKKLIG